MTRETTPLEVATLNTSGKAIACGWCGESFIAKRVNRTIPNYCSTPCKQAAKNLARRKARDAVLDERRTRELIASLQAENEELRRKLVVKNTASDPCSGGCRMRIQLIQELYSPTGQGYVGEPS